MFPDELKAKHPPVALISFYLNNHGRRVRLGRGKLISTFFVRCVQDAHPSFKKKFFLRVTNCFFFVSVSTAF